MSELRSQAQVRSLRSKLEGDVDDSALLRAQYSSDASNYRVLPDLLVFPKSSDDILETLAVARRDGIPLTMRGGGTSVAGNAIGSGIVVDTSRYLNRIIDFDAGSRTAVVEPGVALAQLQKLAAPHGLRFGPDPSTHARCTLGGMIGNDACGPHALAYGRTSDNVLAMDVVDGAGRRFQAGRGAEKLPQIPNLPQFLHSNLAVIRTELGRFQRQVSGYSLEHLLPENGYDLAKALVGTEGTCVVVLNASLRLVEYPPVVGLVVLGYPDIAAAADAVPSLLHLNPLAMEGIDSRLVDVVRRHHGANAVPRLPSGGGWLMVEVGGQTEQEALEKGREFASQSGASDVLVLPSGPEATRMWRIREDGAGLAGRTATGAQAWPGWEDAAVPPAKLGSYLRQFEALLREHDLHGLTYGHFGDGCVHVRLDLPLADNPERLRPFLSVAADLVATYGGSLSGEHGDGRARSELLPHMYSSAAILAFEQFKALFDPHAVLNPGIVVHPAPVDANLRRPDAAPLRLEQRRNGMAFEEDDGDFTRAVHRCVGIAKCRVDNPLSTGFMCPSYRATRNETHSTRGRARVLQELANGSLLGQGFRSHEVHEALDLCLSCKACHSDCPAGVQMAKYKSEVLYQAYKGRLRPRSHYVLGRLPIWTRAACLAPRLINWLLKVPPIRFVALRVGGIDSRRTFPQFATQTFRRLVSTGSDETEAKASVDRVVLWADSFTDAFSPEVGEAMIAVLEAAGYQVLIPTADACCGLTWISTGQLDAARSKLTATLSVLAPFAEAGIPIIGIEPSCTAVLRDDLVELLPDDPRSQIVRSGVFTLAEFLEVQPNRSADDRWSPPSLADFDVIAQPHCHQYAVMSFDPDLRLLETAGANVRMLTTCCGLAGNFGMERGHYEMSVDVANLSLLPAIREANDGAVLLADGFSCRTQASQLAGVQGMHLAQLLASRL